VGETAKGVYRYRVGRFDTQGEGREGLLRIVQGEWTVLDSPRRVTVNVGEGAPRTALGETDGFQY
jgi:hypothetical protein